MRIYEYRTADPTDDASWSRLARIIRERRIWCARPTTLNDPHEFAWTCDFTPTPQTLGVLAGLLQRTKGHTPSEALRRAQVVLTSGAFGSIGRPVIDEMIGKMRDEIGVACFGSSPDNPALWSRYGGEGTGVSVELEVPDGLLGAQLHRVVYDDNRRIHVEEFIRSMDERDAAIGVYATMLTKTKYWQAEEEIRFLSKRPDIEVRIDGSNVTCVVLGPRVTTAVEAAVRQLADHIPVVQVDLNGLTSACSRQRLVRS